MNKQRPPSISRVLETREGQELATQHGHGPTVGAIRLAVANAREHGLSVAPADLISQAGAALQRAALSPLRPMWNLTGTVLHTNLGRAQLSDSAIAAASAAMARPVALEYDLADGKRGERDNCVAGLLADLTGAPASVLVNNNAAAVLLVLDTFGRGGEVIVSRGELIEIGGAFRLPDLMEATGAKLREVGTTNRTHLKDYAAAITPETRMILKVHPSNFRIEGFTSDVCAGQLAPLARQHGIPLVNDLGSGTLDDLGQFGLPREPTVREAVAQGADIVTFSGDKLLGGPQAGIAVGRHDLIGQLKHNPMKRALRLDKMRLAALEAVLRDFTAGRANPTQIFLAREQQDIMQAAQRLAAPVGAHLGRAFAVEIRHCQSQVGSGASPSATLNSAALAIRANGPCPLEKLAAGMRGLPQPIIGRMCDGALQLDLRCLLPGQEEEFLANLTNLAMADLAQAGFAS